MNPGTACQTGDMPEQRLHLTDTFTFILSASAAWIRETTPSSMEVTRG